MAAVGQVEEAARQLQEENRRAKARVNDQEDRLKRLATQVKKEEELVAARSKKAGVRPDNLKDLAAKDATVKKLLQQVREKEKQNQALERHITVYKHSFPEHHQHKGPSTRRPLIETPNRSPQKQPDGGSPTRSKNKDTALLQGTDEDGKTRLMLVLEGELTRAREHLVQLQNEQVMASKPGKDSNELSKGSAESVHQLKEHLREISARLTILVSRQQRTRSAFKEEEEQHLTLVNEVDSLNTLLTKVRQDTHQLNRDKEILQLRKGETADDVGKLIDNVRKELEDVDADNRRLREKAFKMGSDIVTVRVTEDEQRTKLEENESLQKQLEALKSRIEKLQVEVDEAEKGELGSVKSMEANLSTLDSESRRLHKDTERLREKVLSLSGQQQAGESLLAVQSAKAGLPDHRGKDKGKEVRRLRRENAQQVREIRKGEQELQLHELLIKEAEQLEMDLSKHIESLSAAHREKIQKLQQKFGRLEQHNARLREQLLDLQQGKQPSRKDKPAAVSAAPPMAAAAAVRSVVEICVEGLVLEKSHAALQGTEEPRTMLLLDFFMHDTQYSVPLVGFAPRARLERSFETVVDQLLMHYLYTDAVRIQLVRIVGLDHELLGECRVPLQDLVLSPSSPGELVLHRVDITDVGAQAGSSLAPARTGSMGALRRLPLGHVKVRIKLKTSIKEQARAFLSSVSTDDKQGALVEQESLLQVKEEMTRRVGATYTLRVAVKELSGAGSKLKVVAMFQLLDDDVRSTETSMTAADGSASLTGGRCALALTTTQELDKRLLSQAMDLCLFDDSDAARASDNGLLGEGHLLLAPLLHRRGVAGIVQLRSPDPANTAVVASLSVDVSWDPEPVGGVAVAAAAASAAAGGSASSAAASWDVRSALWKLRVWADTSNVGTGIAAYQAVFEELMSTARDTVPATQMNEDGLNYAMWQAAIARESQQLALLPAQVAQTHDYMSGSASVVTKEAFLKALVSALDPGPPPVAASSANKGKQAFGEIEEHVPEAGEEAEESAVLQPSNVQR